MSDLITLPPGFVAVKYPGYFWHVPSQRLFSIKTTGVLHPLAVSRGWKPMWNGQMFHGYRISHKGKRRALHLGDLQKLTVQSSVIPSIGV